MKNLSNSNRVLFGGSCGETESALPRQLRRFSNLKCMWSWNKCFMYVGKFNIQYFNLFWWIRRNPLFWNILHQPISPTKKLQKLFLQLKLCISKKSLWSFKKRNEWNQEPSFFFRERNWMLDEEDSITNHNSMKWKKQDFKNLPIS